MQERGFSGRKHQDLKKHFRRERGLGRGAELGGKSLLKVPPLFGYEEGTSRHRKAK